MKLLFLALVAALIALAWPAQAQVFEIVHPEAEQGSFEFELLNGLVLNDVDDGEARSAHEIALGYAPFAFWKSTVAIELVNPESEDVEVEAFEWENVFLLPLGGNGSSDEEQGGFALGFLAKLEVPNEGGLDKGALELGPIGEIGVGPVSIIGNLLVEIPFEDGVDPGLVYALGASTEVSDAIAIGVEAFGSIEEAFGDAPPTDEQEHYLGPALYFEADLGRGRVLEPRLAVLFGLTDAAADAVLSLNFELVF